jgi:hypothetical protein
MRIAPIQGVSRPLIWATYLGGAAGDQPARNARQNNLHGVGDALFAKLGGDRNGR